MNLPKWLGISIALIGFAASPANANFHFMQIEQVIGGVQGDTTAQAIQLRMRDVGQRFVAGLHLIAHDAAGLNPVTIITFSSPVASGATGDRILVSSTQFANTQMQPPVASDFTMTSLIPVAYLPAGRLTFEIGGIIYWSLCWGGAGYTGSTTGSTTNDADGNFGLCYGGALPAASDLALQFTGAATALSTTNAADYAITAGQAVFTNNAGSSQTVPVQLQSFSVE